MEVRTEKIDKRKAADFLSRNANNRPLKPSHVKHLAAVITRGEWVENGEAIMFDERGNLINGQHRCHAVIAAGVPITSLVIRGLSDSAFQTLDQGSKRTAGDVLGVIGEKNCNNLAASAKVFLSIARCYTIEGKGIHRMPSVSATLVVNTINDNPAIREMTNAVANKKHLKNFGVSKIAGVLAYAATYGEYAHMANQFIDDLASGANLPNNSPVLLLRDRLTLSRQSPTELVSVIIKAWNAYAQGKPIGVLRYKASESFPVIR